MRLELGDRLGEVEVTRHLIDLGHQRIAIVTGPVGHASSAERFAGFQTAMRNAGLRVDQRLVRSGDFRFASGAAAMHALMALKQPPTAVFACSDEMALG